MKKRVFRIVILLGVVVSLCRFDCGLVDMERNNPFDPEGDSFRVFSITYDGNSHTGGNVPVDSVEYMRGDIVSVMDNINGLVKTGYSFIGWNTKPDGSGITYLSGHTIVIGASDVILYARWTNAPTYTVVYNANGATSGSVPIDLNHYITGEEVTVFGNIGNLERTGYTFVGWNTSSDGNGTTYIQNQKYVMGASNVILYAKWSLAPRYSVTYNANGALSGVVPQDNNQYLQGATVAVLGNSGDLKRINDAGISYRFVGWNTHADGSGINYTAGQMFAMGSTNVILYGKWAPYVLRDVGPGGGWVFYDKGSYSNGWRYLEVAPNDQGELIPWGCSGTEIFGADSINIGSGYQNTIDIESYCTTVGTAADICWNLSLGGYSDWFLPSIDELVLMNTNLFSYGVGNFCSGCAYWSSSETGAGTAYCSWPEIGNRISVLKTNTFRVRSIRWF